MCGITGFWGATTDDPTTAVERMATAIRHRGPDSAGSWVDIEAGLALGHRRLSILDLSPLGHQPMLSPTGRYVVAFNGEIYNFRALRCELQGRFDFRSDSDTEVLLAAIDAWGLTDAVKRFIGMFAFALWDRESRRLHLVRDRLGIKPLHYGWSRGIFVFASELNAIRAFPGFDNAINRGAVALLLRHNCIPAPHSIYRGIHKLMPGEILTVCSSASGNVESTRFWSACDVATDGEHNPFRGNEPEAIEALSDLIRESVRLRMISDVPIGAFLSGGVDSSTVVAFMQSESMRPVKTFSIGSHHENYDEADYARAVARHLGTDHTELYVTPEDALSVIPRLPAIFDEPFADSSQIPTFLVSALARREVTVSLSGDGGDELFAGYNRHVWAERVWRLAARSPRYARDAAAAAIKRVPPRIWDRAFRSASPVLPTSLRHRMPGYKMHKLADVLTAHSPEAIYRRLASHWDDPRSVVVEGEEPGTVLTDPRMHPEVRDYAARMMYLDLVTYLPDDVLTKVDRASMAVSLEARVPLLDHRVVEFAWRLPLSMKLRDGASKWILRQVLYRHVPKELIERPKTGFGIPLDAWLRGPLRGWAEELLDGTTMEQEGFFDSRVIRRKWSMHLSGKQDLQYELWDVLMFQAWLRSERKPLNSSRDHHTPKLDPVHS